MTTLKCALQLLVLSLFAASSANAQKLNFEVGTYSISAEPPQGSSAATVKLSGLGSYSVSANFSLKSSLELGVGYTVFYSKTISGDMGFGPDIYLYYFPFNEGSGIHFTDAAVNYHEVEQWRPFVDLAFHQRQFQSVQSAYSGFGMGLGTEYQYDETKSLRLGLRSMNLIGPANTKFSYFDVLFGLQLQFR